MNTKLLSAIDMWNALYETGAHFYKNFPHEYWVWLREHHPPCVFMKWHNQPARVVLIFDEEHDLPPVDSPMREPVEWMIEHYHIHMEGQPFVIK